MNHEEISNWWKAAAIIGFVILFVISWVVHDEYEDERQEKEDKEYEENDNDA